MPNRGEMRTDLVGAAGKQFDFEQRKTIPRLQHPVTGGYRPCPFFDLFGNIDPILHFIFFKITFQSRLSGFRDTMDDAQVILMDLSPPQLFVEDPQGLCIFSCDDDPDGIAVNAVDQCRREGSLLFRIVFSLFIKIPLHPADEGIAVLAGVRMDKQTRLFY